MKLHTLLHDFIDIIGVVPAMESIKIIPTANGLQFLGVSRATSQVGMFVLQGNTVELIDGITQPFGIPNLAQIAKIFKAPGFNRLTATADLEKYTFGSEFEQLVLSNEDGTTYKLSVYGDSLSNDRIKVPRLKAGIICQLSTTPTKNSVEIMKYWLKVSRQNGESNVEVTPITRDGKLFFKTVAGSIFDVEYVVDSNANGILNQPYRYNCHTLFRLMSLAQDAKQATLLFGDSGLCRFEIETSCAKYTFLIPAYV
jgi:hypothetical protein